MIIAYAQEGGDATEEQQRRIEEFVKRGGGLVVIHTAAVSLKNRGVVERDDRRGMGSAEDEMAGRSDGSLLRGESVLEDGHPITKGASNFHLDDEIYYDMEIAPEARILATSYTPNVLAGKRVAEGNKPHIYDIQPQMWAYERTLQKAGRAPYRAFVTLPGHQFATFGKPQYRAILLRGIAWAGKRANLDEFCKPEEIEALTYPEGGPQKPEQTLANLEVHPDFTIKLVAAEPLINKPMNFDWDPAGRLWVAETPEYPNGRRGMRPDYRGKEWKDHGGIDPRPGVQERPARDKISILSDSNGDGVMDDKEIFYEGLDLVTGLVFHKDGVIVTQAPEILWLRDTNNDGKADKVEKLYSGLGTNDTHAVINNPRWGWDGWIYATHGYSASSNVLNAKGEKMGNIGSGVVRFLPDGSKIEQYSSKGGNTWGLQITGDNRVMWTQPTSGQLLMHTVLPEYALARGKIGNTSSFKVVEPSPKSFPLMSWEQLAYVQIDWVGSFTASAGTVIYDGGSWPAEYNGDYFTTEPTINVLHHTRLSPDGPSYKAQRLPGRETTEFIRSKDMWWRPIEVRVGPDGAMYVADFYNQAVIHNDTRGPDHNRVNAAVRPDRDHYFGRIWRIDHKQAKKLTVPVLSKTGGDELLTQLAHPNRHVRMNASRLVAEHAQELGAQERNNLQFNSAQAVRADWNMLSSDAKIAALWTIHRIGAAIPAALTAASVADKDPAVRRNAALLAENAGQQPGAASSAGNSVAGAGADKAASNALVGLLADADAGVRLAALRALSSGDVTDEAARGIIANWSKFSDDFQRSAAVGAASKNAPAAIAAALDSGDPALTTFAGQLAQRVAEKGEAAAAGQLVIMLAGKPASADPVKRAILDTLGKSLRQAPPMSPELSKALTQLLASGASGSVLPLAAKWDSAGSLKNEIARLTTSMITAVQDARATDDARFAAATSLLGLRSANPEALASGDETSGEQCERDPAEVDRCGARRNE